MTRIFDALKKAESSREAPPAPSPLLPSPRPAARPAEAVRSVMPLLGVMELAEETVRAMSALRVSLEAALGARSTRSVMFVAPQGGEGSSTIALQFALTLARDSSARPLLVDAHARRSSFTVEEGQRCATLDRRLMSGSPETSAVVAANLFVVPAPQEARVVGMMQPAALRETLDVNGPGFDWIVVDGPPVLDSPDSAALGAVVDGVVMVVQAGRTKRPVLTRAAELMTKSGSRLLGTVLNRRVLEIPEFIYRRI